MTETQNNVELLDIEAIVEEVLSQVLARTTSRVEKPVMKRCAEASNVIRFPAPSKLAG